MSEKLLKLAVVSPSRSVFSGEAKSVVVPAFDGEMGVLPGHAAMLAMLGTGEVRVGLPDGQTKHLAVRGGFLQVNHDNVTVLTPESAGREEINKADLQKEEQTIETQKPTKLDEREALDAKRRWLKAKQKIVTNV
ncbi:MAG TPA: ATP synthase F1 subunit epsilon [Planctomycetota bacterium]|jgi:F-type H+-transporting ATPase subunit epsilon